MTMKKITTTTEVISKNIAFTVMMVLNDSGIVVHKNSLEKLRKSLQKNLDLDMTAQQYDAFLSFRINNKKKGDTRHSL